MRVFKREDIEHHPKQEFQVERIAFFSDAVFAIVITLLVVEFHAPHVTKDSTMAEVAQAIGRLKYNFIAIVISFILVASQWRLHHFLFKYIHSYTDIVVRLSLVMLFPIIFFPFTTSLLAESLVADQLFTLGMTYYLLNIAAASLSALIFYYFVFVLDKRITYDIPVDKRSRFLSHLLFTMLISVAGLLATLIFERYQPIMWTLIVVAVLRGITHRMVLNALERFFKKKKRKSQAQPARK